jgi:hypothetical protein
MGGAGGNFGDDVPFFLPIALLHQVDDHSAYGKYQHCDHNGPPEGMAIPR